jgi:hypothetical protein
VIKLGITMNSSIALRLLWKEYRVQRGLWLAMAVGSVLLQALIVFLVGSDQESFQGIVPVAFMLTGFYAIGSGAITFAIEREEGTQLRPVMLGCPPGLTLTVKTIFGLVATVLLLGTTICSGMLLSRGSLTLPENTFPPEVQRMIVPLALLFVALPYLGCLLWSMFFSLLTRKVIVALGLAAVAMIVTYMLVAVCSVEIVQNSKTGHLRQPVTEAQVFLLALLPCALALLMLGLNYLLTHRWLTRVFFDQTSAKSPSFFKRWRFRRSGLDGSMVVEIGVEDRTAFEVVSPEVAVHQPPPRIGLSLLYATWRPNLWRHLRFLRWREAIETRKLYLGFLLATMVLSFWCVLENNHNTGWHGAVAFLVHAACVACGAMAFRAEQDERKVQRLADMGLRPATVWLSKHLVWFPRAAISIVAILLCVLVVGALDPQSGSRMQIQKFFQETWLNLQLPNALPNHNSEVRLVGRAIILMLTMYGIGQVCSQLVRSTIVSLFVSFILGLAAFGWAAVCYWFNVPFVISVMPLAIGCLLVTWFRTKSWMIDDNRGRAWLWPTASITAALALIYFGTGLFRVYEIPWSKPFFSDGSSAEFNDGLTAEQRAFVMAPVSEEERNTFQLYQRASELAGRRPIYVSGDNSIPKPLTGEKKETVEQAVRLVLEAVSSPHCADFSPGTTNIADVAMSTSGQSFEDCLNLILGDAQREISQGNLAVALDRCRAAFAIARHVGGRGGQMNWWANHSFTKTTLQALQVWAENPDMDGKLIDEAIRIIDEHRKTMLPVEVANFSAAVMVRNTLSADAFTMAELANDSERLPILLASKFPGEQARSRRLLNTLESYDVQSMASYRSQQAISDNGSGSGMAGWFLASSTVRSKSEDVLRYATQTTPLFAMIASGPARDQLCVQDIDTECRIRATKLVLQLLQKQRASGELPATLDEFDASLNDPWAGKQFVWYPEGLPADLKQRSSEVLVEANTPFLMTFRFSQATIVGVESQASANVEPFHGDTMGGFGFSGVNLGGSENATTQGREQADLDSAPAEDANDRNRQPTEEALDLKEAITHVEFVINGPQKFGSANVLIWTLPKKVDAADEENSTDEAR